MSEDDILKNLKKAKPSWIEQSDSSGIDFQRRLNQSLGGQEKKPFEVYRGSDNTLEIPTPPDEEDMVYVLTAKNGILEWLETEGCNTESE